MSEQAPADQASAVSRTSRAGRGRAGSAAPVASQQEGQQMGKKQQDRGIYDTWFGSASGSGGNLWKDELVQLSQ